MPDLTVTSIVDILGYTWPRCTGTPDTTNSDPSFEIDEEEQKVYVFCMRSMASGGAFQRA